MFSAAKWYSLEDPPSHAPPCTKMNTGAFARVVRKMSSFRLRSVRRIHAVAHPGAGAPLRCGGSPRLDLCRERRVGALVIGGIQLDLVVVHEDKRALGMGRGPDAATIGRRSAASAGAAMVTAAAVLSIVRRVSFGGFGFWSRCILFPMLLCGTHGVMRRCPVYRQAGWRNKR